MPLTQVSSRLIEDTLRYVLGASGTNHYTFTGKGLTGAVNDPTLTLSRGHTYIFENRSGGHPFYIKPSIANGGTNDAYNTGVTNNGGGNGTEIVFTVPHDAPDTLYYQCSSHSSMAGQLNIAGSVADGSITESKLADDAVTADKLANSINTAIAANTAKDLTALSASNLTSGTVPDARISASSVTQHVTAFNDSNIRRDIAKLALQIAVDTNRVAYNLTNSFIDQFEDDSGIGTETNTDRDTVNEFVSSLGALSQIAQNAGTAIGNMTDSGGLAAAFDGNKSQNANQGARIIGQGYYNHHVGKDFGSGTTYHVTQVKVTNVTSEGLLNEGAADDRHRMKLQYSDNGSSWSDAWESQNNFTRQSNVPLGTTVTIDGSTASTGTNNIATAGSHRYWRVNIAGNTANGTNIAELEFFARTLNATGTLIGAANTASSSRTKVSGTFLYKNAYGTATIGTDLKIYFTCNGGTNWTEAASYTVGSDFSTGIKTIYLGETTCTAGTDVRYKAVWANQASASKVTQLHGIGINY